MKLVSVSMTGYRRLNARNSMNLDGKLIAIVGANEAGKSSFLEGLLHLNNSNAFIKSGASQEISRGLVPKDTQGVIEARYLVEKEDLEAISHIEDTKKVKWFTLTKAVNGNHYFKIEPRPARNLTHRLKILKGFDIALKQLEKAAIGLEEDRRLLHSDVSQKLGELVDIFSSSAEQVDDEMPEKADALVTRMRSSGIAAEIEYLQTLAVELEALVEKEAIVPAVEAMEILDRYRPAFMLFDDEARGLKSEYDPSAIGPNPPQALENLLKLAKLNLKSLQRYITTQDQGQLRTLLDAANQTLREVFEVAWSQSKVCVHLDVNGGQLHILIKEEGRSYVRIAERSDGLQQYVALLSFVALNSSNHKPILLIDEAETHLHYDAQADLVQMLTRQAEVAQVIYTTHSIGCFPEDLGIGVRLISSDSATTSVVKNWFWVSDKKGFSPLLFGMGASTMAFMPVRKALVTEGITDMILLPSLLREAVGKDYLGFQIVSGLSETGNDNIAILENGAPSTAYLVDRDNGGGTIQKQLVAAGIDGGRIFRLPDSNDDGVVLEDFIDGEIYLAVVNEELKRHNPAYRPMELTDLPTVDRPSGVKTFCRKQGIEPPNKRNVAYGVLEKKTAAPIVEKRRRAEMKNLYREILKALKI